MEVTAQTNAARAQRGVSLMEILLVIAIVAFLIIGGLTLFNQANSASQATRAQQQLGNLVSSIKSLYAGSPDYDGLKSELLYNGQAVPADMRAPANAVTNMVHIYGGKVFVGNSTNGDASGKCDGFTGVGESGSVADLCISFEQLPRKACVQLATSNVGFKAVKVNADVLASPAFAATTGANLNSPAKANEKCNQAGNANTLLFLF